MRKALISVSVLLLACEPMGHFGAALQVKRGTWRMIAVDGMKLPVDTTRVGTFPLSETVIIDVRPARATIISELLTRDMQNRRSVRVDTASGTLLAFGECGAIQFRGSRAEEQQRQFIEDELRPYRSGISAEAGRDLSIGERPLLVAIESDTLRIWRSTCSPSPFDERVYVRSR